jgi:uncharacterized membrane protein
MTAHALAVASLLATIPKKVFLIGGFAVGGLEALLSIPLVMKKVPPNRFYGFANRQTIDSDRVWYAANRFFGLSLLLCGLLTAGGTAVVLAVKSSYGTKVVAGLVLVIVVALFVAALSATVAKLRRL